MRATRDQSIICACPDFRPGTDAILKGFADLGILQGFVTTIGVQPGQWCAKGLRSIPGGIGDRVRKLASRRMLSEWSGIQVETYPWREVVRAGFRRCSGNEILSDRIWWWAESGFDRWVARRHAGRAAFLYGFELASLESFRKQKQLGGWCILGQLIAHHRTAFGIVREELEMYPEAETEYDRHLLKMSARNHAAKDEQFALADVIVANSRFVKDSFVQAGISPDKVIVIPGAGPEPLPEAPESRIRDRAVFICVGALSIRKGTHYLLDAWRKLQPRKNAELWLVGPCRLPSSMMRNLPPGVRVWSGLSLSEVFDLYRQASVLVLPSLCEGFALVILEAMSHGLPVLTTPNSGCGDFVEDGINGWIVPIRDVAALTDRIVWSLENREQLEHMGDLSRRKAAAWTWDQYAGVHAEAVLGAMHTLTGAQCELSAG